MFTVKVCTHWKILLLSPWLYSDVYCRSIHTLKDSPITVRLLGIECDLVKFWLSKFWKCWMITLAATLQQEKRPHTFVFKLRTTASCENKTVHWHCILHFRISEQESWRGISGIHILTLHPAPHYGKWVIKARCMNCRMYAAITDNSTDITEEWLLRYYFNHLLNIKTKTQSITM